jgi:hypothetical protein
VVPLVEPVTPPVDPLLLGLELLELESVLLGVELEPPELDPVLGPPIELVLPLLLGDEPLLPLPVLGVVPAVLLEPVPAPMPLLEGEVVLLDEPVDPGAPAEPVVSRLLQALSESAATTARVAAAH